MLYSNSLIYVWRYQMVKKQKGVTVLDYSIFNISLIKPNFWRKLYNKNTVFDNINCKSLSEGYRTYRTMRAESNLHTICPIFVSIRNARNADGSNRFEHLNFLFFRRYFSLLDREKYTYLLAEKKIYRNVLTFVFQTFLIIFSKSLKINKKGLHKRCVQTWNRIKKK